MLENILFVSDLDGTLLDKNSVLPIEETAKLNRAIELGAQIAFATARSPESARARLSGVNCKLPISYYNGAILCDSQKIVNTVSFSRAECELLGDLLKHTPYVLRQIKGGEFFYYYNALNTGDMDKAYMDTHNYYKFTPTDSAIFADDGLFTLLSIDKDFDNLNNVYNAIKDKTHAYLYKDLYSDDYWLDIMPLAADKGADVKRLAQFVGASKCIVFGDHHNDISMFKAADISYAVNSPFKEVVLSATYALNSPRTVADVILSYVESR